MIVEVPFASSHYRSAVALRDAELRRPLGLVQTAEDTAGEDEQVHCVALDENGLVTGTVLLKQLAPTRMKLRQMVVAPGQRGTGLGARLVRFAEELARTRGIGSVELNARASARGFYERLGYAAVGEPFTEVGLPHIAMVRTLPDD